MANSYKPPKEGIGMTVLTVLAALGVFAAVGYTAYHDHLLPWQNSIPKIEVPPAPSAPQAPAAEVASAPAQKAATPVPTATPEYVPAGTTYINDPQHPGASDVRADYNRPPPPVDFAAIYAVAEHLPYTQEVVAKTLRTYDYLNPQERSTSGRTAAELFAIFRVEGDPYGYGLKQAIELHAKRAREEGCRDPLIQAIHAGLFFFDADYSCESPELRPQLEPLFNSTYPAILKYDFAQVALTNYCSLASSGGTARTYVDPPRDIPNAVRLVLKEFQSLINTAPPSDLLVDRACEYFGTIAGADRLLKESEPLIDSLLEQAHVSRGDRDYCHGSVLILRAWGIRGNGVASTVSDENARLFQEHLAEAETFFIQAANGSPDNYRIPTEAMNVELGQGLGLTRLDYWFKSATTIKPGWFQAYRCKMNYLMPKWYGSDEDVYKFGLECVQTGLWKDRVPLVFLDGYEELAREVSSSYYTDEKFWPVVDSVCREYLKRYPLSIRVRSRYLNFAGRAKKWDIVREQMKILGPYWDFEALDPGLYHEFVDEMAKR